MNDDIVARLRDGIPERMKSGGDGYELDLRTALKTMSEAADIIEAQSKALAEARAVKPLEWVKHPNADMWRAETIVGLYQASATFVTSWNFDGWDGIQKANGDAATADAAKAAAQADYEARVLSALVAPSQPAAVGGRADALWEQLLPLMQVEECPPGDPYKDKVAALALIEAALQSTP